MQKTVVLVDTAHVATPHHAPTQPPPTVPTQPPPTVPDVSPLCTAPLVTGETITHDELYALRDEAIASGDDGTRNIACGALNAVDEFQGFACRHACAVVLNAKRSGRP